MSNRIPYNGNLPPGCTDAEIERRFGDGDPDVDANDSTSTECENCNGTGMFNGALCKCCQGMGAV